MINSLVYNLIFSKPPIFEITSIDSFKWVKIINNKIDNPIRKPLM